MEHDIRFPSPQFFPNVLQKKNKSLHQMIKGTLFYNYIMAKYALMWFWGSVFSCGSDRSGEKACSTAHVDEIKTANQDHLSLNSLFNVPAETTQLFLCQQFQSQEARCLCCALWGNKQLWTFQRASLRLQTKDSRRRREDVDVIIQRLFLLRPWT